ncbi:maleylacetoacetate isomerase [Parachitinimonas caeni]|uniref:Maleylacetoacetate isomerase n=1 Tax=Parachitinimonas caeni TaxID=3031301 RepID=A0ABT7DWR8_9NEIS|nr:maleylacetoacetate isomerase [Parachitinimonas caeni]MDK2124505.1 maleylacetoacetate isomerase [Parachitinimonas caeni]
MERTLYTYFRSSAAWRTRIALLLKGLPHQLAPIHLLRNGGEQHSPEYKAINPQEVVPTLQEGDIAITQSLAIIEYLDEVHPSPPLLPADPLARARVRELALTIACDIHPVNNLKILQYLKGPLGRSQQEADDWYRHWIRQGFDAFEKKLAALGSGDFCVGDHPTIADLCLVPQVFNARRFNVDLTPYPRIVRIDAHCMTLPAFIESQPSRQPDAE